MTRSATASAPRVRRASTASCSPRARSRVCVAKAGYASAPAKRRSRKSCASADEPGCAGSSGCPLRPPLLHVEDGRDSHRSLRQFLFLGEEGLAKLLRLFLDRLRQAGERSLRESLVIAHRREPAVAKRVDELDRAQGIEPGVKMTEKGFFVVRAGYGFPNRAERPHLLEGSRQQVGTEEWAVAGQLSQR